MAPNPPLGILLHAIGGLAAGTFYSPLRRIKRWSWESYWLAMGLAAWIITPFVVAWITTPELLDVLRESPQRALGLAFTFGCVWGVGSTTFGLAMRYLGIALGMAVALGFCAAFGTLIPVLVNGDIGTVLASRGGQVVLVGVFLCLVGIGICGWAGVRKERELSDEEKRAGVEEFELRRGFVVAVISGIMSAGFAYGLEAGAPIAEAALKHGADPLYQNNATLVVITLGGFLVNLFWCLGQAVKNRSLSDYVTGPIGGQLANYLLAAIGGVVWYGQFFFYGMGTTKLGDYDFSSWSLHMAFIIIFSNLAGLALGEWKGSSSRTLLTVAAALGVLIFSTVVIGYGNWMTASA